MIYHHLSAMTVLASVLLCTAASAQPAPATQESSTRDISLTIYSSADPAGFDPQQFIAQQRQGYNPQAASQVPGFGVVRDVRTLNLKENLNTVSFTDVAEFIDPTTVSLVDLSVPAAQREAAGVRVLQQKFAFDLVSPQKLLDSYIDRNITVNQNLGDGKTEAITGKLLSSNQGRIVLQTAAGIRMLNWGNDIQLGALPGGLITKPTLQWDLFAPAAGQRKVRTSYQTSGITWRSDYNLVINADDTQADLGAWVTLLNLSGTSYPNTQLKLIAGDVQRITTTWEPEFKLDAATSPALGLEKGFEEKAFFEYHMYTLPRKVDIDQNATQQLVLFPTAGDVKVEKVLVYYGQPSGQYWHFSSPATDRNLGSDANKKLDVYIKFENKEDNNLGMPLPRGKIRVFKNDGDTLEFIGEDIIDHTTRNQTVLIKIGQSFDVTGDRVQTNFTIDNRAHVMTETIKITLKNAKDVAQKVIVRENLYRWTNWELRNKSDDFEKIDSRTVHFPVTVPAGGEKEVTYTVRYTW